MSSIQDLVASALRAEIARQRKSSVELASVLGCSRSSASRRMRGDTGLNLDDIATICEWLGVDVSELIPARAQADAS